MLSFLPSDLRGAFRSLGRNPLFTCAALGALTLSVGGNSAVCTLLDRVLLRPLPQVQGMDRLAFLDVTAPSRPDWAIGLNPGDYQAIRTHARLGAAFGAWSTGGEVLLASGGAPQPMPLLKVSWDFFPALGVSPLLGRSFQAEEDRKGGPPVALLSQGCWKSRFGGDPAVLGRTLNLDGIDRVIVGVMPALASSQLGKAAESGLILPLAFSEEEASKRSGGFLHAVARLKPGATLPGLDAEIQGIVQGLPPIPGRDQDHFRIRTRPLRDALHAGWRKGVLLQSGAMAALLLIACSNLANMLLARGVERRKEMAVRAALGAGRSSLLRPLLLEAGLLGLGGGLGGLFLGQVILRLLVTVLPPHPALAPPIPLDPAVAALTLGLGLGSTLLFALAPILRLTRGLGPEDLRSGRAFAGSLGASRLRKGLVVAEVAMATAMLFCATLLLRSARRLEAFRPGFDPKGVMVAQIRPRPGQGEAPPADLVLARLQAVPGVQSAALSWMTPADIQDGVNEYRIPGEPERGEGLQSACNGVTPGYFRTHGIRFLEGRTFQPGEGGAVVVNQALARQHWPGQSALGHTLLSQATGFEHPLTVVGVVEDVRVKSPGEPLNPQTYFPREGSQLRGTLSLRVQGPLQGAALERILAEVAPQVRLSGVTPLETLVDRQSHESRAKGILLGAYAVTALALASLGIYGLMAFSVKQRHRELGIRLALGATRERILSLVLGQGLRLTALGLASGLGSGLLLGSLLAGQLFGIRPWDPGSLAASGGMLALVSLSASFLPALWAARVDPVNAMRAE